jgi:D-sedoheptulose 7-phosphate isomerase
LYESVIVNCIEDSITLKRFLQKEAGTLLEIAKLIIIAFKRGNKVILMGNGGSAADAQHLAAEFSGKMYRDRAPLPALALTTNSSSITAIANDYGYDTVFSRQIQGILLKGDVVIGISTSGNSPNIVLALEKARQLGAVTVAFTGEGGKLNQWADIALAVPSKDTPRVQEAHITAGHVICQIVEEEMFFSEQGRFPG